MVFSLPKFFFFSLLLSVQTNCIYQIACVSDFCAPDSKMHEINQKEGQDFEDVGDACHKGVFFWSLRVSS